MGLTSTGGEDGHASVASCTHPGPSTQPCAHTHPHVQPGALCACFHPCEGSSDTVQETFAHADLIRCLKQGRKLKTGEALALFFPLLCTRLMGGER